MRFVILLSITMAAAAQEMPLPDLAGLVYPPLARAARVQGTVQVAVTASGAEVVSGNPILRAAALAHAQKWKKTENTKLPVTVLYLFQLDEGNPQTLVFEEDVPVGNAFGRFFLRVLRRPTTRRVRRYECVDPRPPKPSSRVTAADVVEITVLAGPFCIETSTGQVAGGS